MGNFRKWLAGLIIIGIAALIFHIFTPWGAKAHSVKMGEVVKSTLTDGGFSSVIVEMAGNVAKLSGSAPSDEVKNSIVEITKNAQCDNCANRRINKRWHVVEASGLTVKKLVPTVSPYTLSGVRDGNGAVVLNGYASSEQERSGILSDAEALFPGNVTDDKIKIATGAPNADWRGAAAANLAGLAKLDGGKFSMNNENSYLTGKTLSTDARSDVNGIIGSLPTGYSGATNVVVPNAEAENMGTINSEEACQTLFDDLKGDAKINFAYNRAEIGDENSLALIRTLASAVTQCSSFRITVDGHTDADGSEAYNLDLSRRRAEEVVRNLVAFGVEADNITGDGYGESRPIARNDTPEGMAKNRRIDFKVTRSK